MEQAVMLEKDDKVSLLQALGVFIFALPGAQGGLSQNPVMISFYDIPAGLECWYEQP